MEELKTISEVIEAILEGKEFEFKSTDTGEWLLVKNQHIPVGYFDDKFNYLYRTKPSKPSIDWSHVSDEFNFLARDKDGSCYLYENKPELEEADWWTLNYGTYENAAVFKSLEVGNCDWTESLVERPDYLGDVRNER